MSHDADQHHPAAPDAGGAPLPIVVPSATWELGSSPGELEGVAGILRSLGSAGVSARDTMDRAVFEVFANGAWEGDTAAAYQEHRGKLSGDLGGFADAAEPAARALDETAAALRSGQEMLDAERAQLNGIPGYQLLGQVFFLPRDEDEAATVRGAVAAAEEIRAWVDGEIGCRIAAFRAAEEAFETIADTWQPRTVRHLNLNAGMGNRDDSTTRDDLGELAAAIAAGDADVVTLQEVLEGNLEGEGGLLSQLEAETGQEWQVAAFAEGIPVEPDWDPDNSGEQGYGNAVLVRTGGAVALPADHDQGPVELGNPVDDALAQVFTGETPENRVAAVAEVTIREPGG